ncbi:MAG TPA: PHP-associated domain-containing protein [Anaerolineaceae bacterium]|jgi:predicted metal-dependent phosphoesterase TrpH|nr:PHP domain-containing protein [Anaerolineaceae bacterium]HOA21182.1 PHP-associated domain-containing protein [Anaerolineaceae bacterium]HOG77856.1 PHP-associated domain-containing protein [Anaerolineaceae bacterium]
MNSAFVKAEFHCHTRYSPDSLMSLEALLLNCRKKGIGKVAVTDHNRLAGALKAHEMAPDLVIVSEEIMTTEGEILAYFLTEEIPEGLHPLEVVRRLREQNAFISVAHPFDPYRGSRWQKETLESLAPHLDGIEVFNARCVENAFNQKALAFAQEFALPQMVGSDAHSTFELGRAVLFLPDFSSADTLRVSLRSAEKQTRRSASIVHFVSTWAKLVKSTGVGA